MASMKRTALGNWLRSSSKICRCFSRFPVAIIAVSKPSQALVFQGSFDNTSLYAASLFAAAILEGTLLLSRLLWWLALCVVAVNVPTSRRVDDSYREFKLEPFQKMSSAPAPRDFFAAGLAALRCKQSTKAALDSVL